MLPEVAISDLQTVAVPSELQIRGLITLLWPFSASAETCAVFLAATDARARSRGEQVRINFIGPAAKAFAASKASISDTLVLGLDGAQRVKQSCVQTPGKSVGSELVFTDKLQAQVISSGGVSQEVSVDLRIEGNSEPAISSQRPDVTTPSRGQSDPAPISIEPIKSLYGSPAFLGKHDKQISYERDPFLDDDDAENNEKNTRKRARVSFGHIRDWRYVRRTPSPVHNTHSLHGRSLQHAYDSSEIISYRQGFANQELKHESAVPEVPTQKDALQPPSLLVLHTTERGDHVASTQSRVDDTPSAPRLHSVIDASLPLPSPFRNEVMQPDCAFSHDQAALANDIVSRDAQSDRQTTQSAELVDDAAPAVTSEYSPEAVLTEPRQDVGVGHLTSNDIQKTMETNSANATTSEMAAAMAMEDRVVMTEAGSLMSEAATSDRPSMTASTLEYSMETASDTTLIHDAVISTTRRLPSFATEQREQALKHSLRNLFGFASSTDETDTVDGPEQPASVDQSLTADVSVSDPTMVQLSRQQDNMVAMEPTSGSMTSERFATHRTTIDDVQSDPFSAEQRESTALLGLSIQPSHQEDALSTAIYTDQLHTQTKRVSQSPQCGHSTSPDALSSTGVIAVPESNSVQTSSTRSERDIAPSEISSTHLLAPTNSTRHQRKMNTEYQRTLPRSASNPVNNENQQSLRTVTSGPLPQLSNVIDPTQTNGFWTPRGYFNRLGSLTELLNDSSTRVDILAVVEVAPLPARRQENRPRDWYITTRVMDKTVSRSLQVEMYRPNADALPGMETGDVILLHKFSIVSREHSPVLKTNDESAWLVWRFSAVEHMVEPGRENQPPGQHVAIATDIQPVSAGPPVESGVQEQEEAVRLWTWYKTLSDNGPAMTEYEGERLRVVAEWGARNPP